MGWLDKFKKTVPDVQKKDVERTGPFGGLDAESLKLAEELVQGKKKKYLGMIVDATGSRQATWDLTQKILRNILRHLSETSGLMIRVIYFGGGRIGEIDWQSDLLAIQERMAAVECEGGVTQIVPALRSMLVGGGNRLPQNVILLGDAFEEKIEDLKEVLKFYRTRKIRVFSFFDTIWESKGYGRPEAGLVFQKIAKVTNGVYQEYSEDMYLDELMVAVAALTAEGKEGLDKLVSQKSRGALALQKELLQIEQQNQG